MLDYIRSIASRRRDAETGASAVEYGLLVALIAAVIVLAVFALGGLVRNTFNQTCDEIQTSAEIENTECAPADAGGGE
jgi:pilus assembly protein Flp/PilA